MKPSCPKCGKTRPGLVKGGRYKCNRCHAIFDQQPNEGGDYHADPAKRMMIAEATKGKR
jgi:ribosomal protein L37AE/L43A